MRKQRTREHIIEDLGINHIERQVFYAGYTFYRYTGNNDYGYDVRLKFPQKDIWNAQAILKLRHIKTNLRNAII